MKTLIGIIAILVIWGIWAIGHRNSSSDVTSSSTATTVTDTTSKGTGTPVGTLATSDQIQVTAPVQNQTISSPVKVTGKARGNWFFEASAPVYVIDAAGNVLGQGVIQATSDWMTTDFVPFTGSIAYSAPDAGMSQGAVILMNDNPSGQASTSLFAIVPIRFAPGGASTSTATSTAR
jgi:hypothetical protein